MDELAFTHKLDLVLDHLVIKFKESTDYQSKPDFATTLNELKSYVNRDELKAILTKLRKDGYVEFSDYGSPGVVHQPETRYIVTFEGLVHDELKGYTEQAAQANKEKEQIAIQKKRQDDQNGEMLGLSKRQTANNEKIGTLTKWIVFVTAPAGVYYLLEIIKFFAKLLSCHHH